MLQQVKTMSLTDFNKQFSLSFDGKYKGLPFALSQLPRPELFYHKLNNKLTGVKSRYGARLGDVISFSVSGHSVKLYLR